MPLQTKAVKKFGGLQQYRTSSAVSMDEALKCMNVITAPGGFLQKMKIPTPLTPQITQAGNASIIPFQQGDGTRQLLVTLGTQIWLYTTDALIPALIDDNPLNAAEWSAVTSNNLLFMANGKRMIKWTGQFIQNWGIAQPPVPTQGVTIPCRVQRTSGTVTVDYTPTLVQAEQNGYDSRQLATLTVGDQIIIADCPDDTFNGNQKVSAIAPFSALNVQYANAGSDSGVLTANLTIFSVACASSGTDFNVTSLGVKDGIATAFFTSNFRIIGGDQFTIAGASGAYAAFNGTFTASGQAGARGALADGVVFPLVIPDIPQGSPGSGVTVAGGFDNSAASGNRTWKCAWKNSVTGHESSASDATPICPNNSANLRAYLTAPKPTDGQVDTVVWYATLQGGGDYFKIQEAPISAGLVFGDGRVDALLDTQTRCQLINNPPPLGTYLTKWQDRVYVSGIIGSPQDIAFSGYERILVGRPEESFPPNNRLRLSIGADDVRATGAIQAGLVAWSHSSEMFMLRGSVEDIVTDNPVPPSSYLEQLPWNQGANSHYAVQGTPQGLIWFASDNTIQLWNGVYLPEYMGPKQMAEDVYPTLNRVNPKQKQFAKSAWLNTGDREWYILLLALDQSPNPNLMLFFDVTEGDANAGVFQTNIQADDVNVWEDSTGLMHLLILQNGGLLDFPYQSTAINGLAGVNPY